MDIYRTGSEVSSVQHFHCGLFQTSELRLNSGMHRLRAYSKLDNWYHVDWSYQEIQQRRTVRSFICQSSQNNCKPPRMTARVFLK